MHAPSQPLIAIYIVLLMDLCVVPRNGTQLDALRIADEAYMRSHE